MEVKDELRHLAYIGRNAFKVETRNYTVPDSKLNLKPTFSRICKTLKNGNCQNLAIKTFNKIMKGRSLKISFNEHSSR